MRFGHGKDVDLEADVSPSATPEASKVMSN
jgi:hypothetical protein